MTAVHAPRCGREMVRYEVPGREAAPGMPAWCGRPEGHPGPCRTPEALRSYMQDRDRKRTERYRAARAAGLSYADASKAKVSDRQLALALRKEMAA